MFSILRVLSVGIVFICLSCNDDVSDDSNVNGETSQEGRIVGGETSKEGAWPFMASIGRSGKKSRRHFCGGVVWDDETILTAAHCIADSKTGVIKPNLSNLNVYLGNTNLATIDSTYLFKVKWVEAHPLEKAYKDIAIIKLAEKIDFEGKHRKVDCICNPEPLSKLNSSACIALGWGLTKRPNPKPDATFLPKKLQQVQQEIHSNSVCQAILDKYPAGKRRKYKTVNFLCAGTTKKGISRGDSGGPLVCQVKAHPKKYSLVGLSSFGKPKGACFFTRVWIFMDWIEKAVERNDAENDAENYFEHITEHARAYSIFGEGHLVKLAFLGTFFTIGLLVAVACCRRKHFNDSAKKSSLMNKSSKLNRKMSQTQSKTSSILSKERSKKKKCSHKSKRRSNRKRDLRKLSSTRTASNKKVHK